VALPSDLSLVDIIGTYVDYNGDPIVGTIEFTATTRVVSGATHTAVLPDPVIGKLDASGQLKAADGVAPLKILATDDPDGNPVGWTWSVLEKFTGRTAVPFNLAAPSLGGSIDLPSASPTTPPVIPGGTAVTKINAKVPNGAGLVTLVPADIAATFPPDPHSHPISGVTNLQAALDGKEATGVAAAGDSTHAAAADPHPQYLTPAEGAVAYAAIAHTHTAADLTGLPLAPAFSISGPIAVTTGTYRWYNDTGRTLNVLSLRASAGQAPTGGPLTVAAKKNGVAFPSPLTASIAAGSNTGVTTATDQTLAPGDYLTIDVTLVGTTVTGSNLTVVPTMVSA
jgi:hypothetical protein